MEQIQNMSAQKQDNNSGALGLAILGGILLIAGVATFIARSWDIIDPMARIAIAVLAVITAHGVGYALTQARNYAYTGSIFHVVGMVLLPTAFAVIFTERVTGLTSEIQVFIAATAGALAYVPFAYQSRRSIFVVFGMVNVLIALGTLARIAFGEMVGIDMNYIYLILIMICGYSAYLIKDVVYPAGHSILFALGVIGTAGFGFFMGVFSGFYSYSAYSLFNTWDLWYPILVGAMIYLGVEIKSELMRWSGILGLVAASFVLIGKYGDDIGMSVIIAVIGALLLFFAYRIVQKEREGK